MGTDSLASGFWVAFRIEPPAAAVAWGQPTAPFCALPNGSLNKAGLTCHRSPTAGVGRPKLFARGRADRSALTIHLLRSCWDPPYTSGFPVVGVLVGLYASLQFCHQSINPPSDARRRAPKNNSPTTLCYAFQLYLLERSRICDVPDPCAPGPQQGVGRPK